MNTKYFQNGGFTIAVSSELPFKRDTFHDKLKPFELHYPEKNRVKAHISIKHFFKKNLRPHGIIKDRIYCKKPWAIFKNNGRFIYDWITDENHQASCRKKFIANKDHTIIEIHHGPESTDTFLKGNLTHLSSLPTDHLFLCRALASHEGCIIHSMGLICGDNGYLFVGHSTAGKSTLANIMKDNASILCDDRNIIRKHKNKYNLYGSWQHSNFPQISALSAPLKGIFFLDKSSTNQIDLITDQKTKFAKLLDCLVKPFAADDWWPLSLAFLDNLTADIDCWNLKFDKSGKIRDYILNLSSLKII